MQADAPFRIGQGFDVHGFAPDRPLILGGVRIDHPLGLAGHSDADVLAHAVMDALLGAAGLGDIGHLFPDTDPAYRGADSLQLLASVASRLEQAGLGIVHVDATIVAQAPRVAPYVPAMIRNLAGAMGLDPSRVQVKATTTERLGFVGRGEGIAALAVALIGAVRAAEEKTSGSA